MLSWLGSVIFKMFYFTIVNVNTLLVKSDYTGLVHRTGFVTEDDSISCSHKAIDSPTPPEIWKSGASG